MNSLLSFFCFETGSPKYPWLSCLWLPSSGIPGLLVLILFQVLRAGLTLTLGIAVICCMRMCVGGVWISQSMCGVRGNLAGVGSVSTWTSNSGHQVEQKVLLPAEPSCWPSCILFSLIRVRNMNFPTVLPRASKLWDLRRQRPCLLTAAFSTMQSLWHLGLEEGLRPRWRPNTSGCLMHAPGWALTFTSSKGKRSWKMRLIRAPPDSSSVSTWSPEPSIRFSKSTPNCWTILQEKKKQKVKMEVSAQPCNYMSRVADCFLSYMYYWGEACHSVWAEAVSTLIPPCESRG